MTTKINFLIIAIIQFLMMRSLSFFVSQKCTVKFYIVSYLNAAKFANQMQFLNIL